MATDATGTPTTKGIPKYDTANDAPSGLGFNAAMDAIDTLLNSYVTKPSGLGSGDVPVWNGTTWVRSSVTQVSPTGLGTGSPSASTFLRGDGAWAGAFSTYTPSWTASAVNPAVGDGAILGRYLQIGKLVHLKISLTMGTTTTYGTGDWRFSLPVTASASVASNGEAAFFDTSGAAYYRGLSRWNGANLQVRTNASPTVLVDATNPFTWANGDTLQIDLWYEAA